MTTALAQASKANTSVSTEEKIYTGTALRIMKLLGAGCLPVEAARACGVGESLVSQYQAEPSFARQLNALVTKAMTDQSKIDTNYNEIERIASERLLQAVEYVFDPDKAMRIAKFANEAKRRIAPGPGTNGDGNSGTGSEGGTTIKTLILPVQILNQFTVSPTGEIVGINGTPLTTLPSKNIDHLVAKHKKEEQERKQGFSLIEEKLAKPKNGPGPTDPYSDL